MVDMSTNRQESTVAGSDNRLMDNEQRLVSEALELTCGNLKELAAETETSRQALYSWAIGERTPSIKKLTKLYLALAARTARLESVVQELSDTLLERAPEDVRQVVEAASLRIAMNRQADPRVVRQQARATFALARLISERGLLREPAEGNEPEE